MNCPKHPYEKMTLLFTSYVCDVCEPPKQKQVVNRQTMPDWNELLWRLVSRKHATDQPPQFTILCGTEYNDLMLQADVALRFDDFSMKVYVEKNRYGDPTISTDDCDMWNALNPSSKAYNVGYYMNITHGMTAAYHRMVFIIGRR